MRELKDDNIVRVQYVSSSCNYVDILSKCIVGGEFSRKVNMISNNYKKRRCVKSREDIYVKLAKEKSKLEIKLGVVDKESGGAVEDR